MISIMMTVQLIKVLPIAKISKHCSCKKSNLKLSNSLVEHSVLKAANTTG